LCPRVRCLRSRARSRWLLDSIDTVRGGNSRASLTLAQLEEWPENVKMLQRNWIGQSKGVKLNFDIVTEAGEPVPAVPQLEVFTTRADTLLGVSYVAVAPEHAAVKAVLQEGSSLVTEEVRASVAEYVSKLKLTEVSHAIARLG
jgi:leucyl-tRNA synthetase